MAQIEDAVILCAHAWDSEYASAQVERNVKIHRELPILRERLRAQNSGLGRPSDIHPDAEHAHKPCRQ